MSKPAQFKAGIVLVKEGETPGGRGFWELRYTDPDTKHEIKRRVSGLTRDEVKAMADHLTRQAYQGRGYLPERGKGPTVAEGIAESIRLTRARDDTKRGYSEKAMLFRKWLGERYPTVKTWGGAMRPAMIVAYMRELEAAGLARDTIRLRLVPVKAAWRHVSENWPDLVKPLPRITQAPAPKREIECLDAGEVAGLLDWLKQHKPAFHGLACLQALAGLRVSEAAYLRAQDVDLEAGTVTVGDTGRHVPKNAASFRTIPVCGEVLEALRGVMVRQRVRPVSGELFTNADGGGWTVLALSHRWRAVLRQAAATPRQVVRGNGRSLPVNVNGLSWPRLAAVPAHRLRASFATIAGRLGVPDRLTGAYMGHAAPDVLGGHYRRIDLEELRSVSERIGAFREAGQGEKGRKDSGNMAPARERGGLISQGLQSS